MKSYSLEKNPPENDQKKSQRIKVSKPLHNLRHIGNGKYKTTEHKKRQNEKEGSHHGLLFGCGYCRYKEPYTQCAEQKQAGGEKQ